MSLDEGTSSLIGSIYGAVDDRAAWLGVLDTILERTASRLMLVSAVDLRSGDYSDTCWRGPDNARLLDGLCDYETDMFRGDPTLAFAMRHPAAGQVSLDGELARQGRDPATDEYARWVRDRLGVSDSVVRYTPPINGLTLGVSIHAPAAAGCYDPRSLALFLMLFEHVERAMRLAVRAPDFTSQDRAIVLVASDGRVVSASDPAGALLAGRDGLTLVDHRLATASRVHDRRLDAAIAAALGPLTDGSAGGALALPRPSGRPDLLVRIDPLPRPPAPFEAFRPAALVSVTEPDAAAIGARETRKWARLFGLTPAETRLTAALLTDDASLRTVADRLGIAYATARVQLAGVFDKVGVRSQAQLARLLTRIGAWLIALWPALDQAASVMT